MSKGSFIVPSINVDSCIIEEQDDHLVLAIRIPKATIVANLPVLAALAERCGAVWSTRADPPLRSNRWLDIGGFFRQMPPLETIGGDRSRGVTGRRICIARRPDKM
jgi:hypothetical protein